MGNVRVFRYGLLPPTENADVIHEQMRLAHRYRNTLIEIERARRAAIREVHSSAGDMPALEEAKAIAEKEFAAAEEAVLRVRAAARKRSVVPPEMKERLERARAERAAARKAVSEARAKLNRGELKADLEQIGTRANELLKNARAYSGLARRGPYTGFGTYQLAEMAMEQSKKSTPFYEDPRFIAEHNRRRFQVGVQIDGGLPADEIYGSTGWVQVNPVDEAAWNDRTHGEARSRGQGRRAKMRTTLRLRLGVRVDTGEVLYGSWPMVMHREIPKGAIIKRVDVTKERVGRREQWYVCFSVDLAECERRVVCGEGRVAIGFGWRALAEGELRVAVSLDEKGNAVEESLQRDWIDYAKKPRELREVRDKNFNAARDALASWIAGNAESLPPWFQKQTATLSHWRSENRLYALARRWRDERFPGDDDAYLALEKWRYHEHHLEEWESAQRAKSVRQRREQYRIFAKRMSESYGELVLAKFDRRPIAKRPDTLDEHQNKTANANRHLASTSELELALKQAFLRAGGTVAVVDSAHATHDCAFCEHRNAFGTEQAVNVTCEKCGETWDQDVNLCQNLLIRRERSSEPQKPGGSRNGENERDSAKKYEGKWTKRKQERGKRSTSGVTARIPGEEAAE